MVSTERVTVRLSSEQIAMIQQLIDENNFDTVTDVVRTALEEFLQKYFSPEHIKKITVDLPKSNVLKLEELVKDGDSVSLDDAIRTAVREYTKDRL